MKSFVLTSAVNWVAVSAVFPNQQHISNIEAAPPYHPTQHMFMIEHDQTLLETLITVAFMLYWLLLLMFISISSLILL
jgi:hypothetical protein